MEIFRQLKKLGYKHYADITIEELDNLPINDIEKRIEYLLVIDWMFTEKKLSIDTDFTETESEYGFQYTISKLGDYNYNDEEYRHSCKTIYNFENYYKTKTECYNAAILKVIELIQ